MKRLTVILTMVFMLCFAAICLAADDFSVAETSFDGTTRLLRAIINDNRTEGESISNVTATVDGLALTETAFQNLNQSDVPFTFCFVVDTTTTSITDQKTIPSKIAAEFANQRGNKKDEYILISYDSTVHEPVGPSRFAENVLSDLKYEVKAEGDHSDALNEAVTFLKGLETFSKKVIILISDGRQVTSPKMDASSLEYMLEEAGYPIYAYGLKQSEGDIYVTSNLDKLSQLSRITGGLYYSDSSTVAAAAGQNYIDHMMKSGVFTGTLPDEHPHEGSSSAAMKVSIFAGDTLLASLDTLFNLNSESSDQNADQTELRQDTEGTTEEQESETTPEPVPDPGIFDKIIAILGPNWLLIIIAGLLLIVLIVLVIVMLTRGKKKEPEFIELPEENIIAEPPAPANSVTIELTDRKKQKMFTTTIENGGYKIFGRVTDKENGIVGLNGDSYISKKQFMLSWRAPQLVIEDMGSLNGTYLNDERVRGKVNVRNGVIRIGNVAGEREFEIRIRK